jgi:serine protease Do
MTFKQRFLFCLICTACILSFNSNAQKSSTESSTTIIINGNQDQKPDDSEKGFMGIFVDQNDQGVFVVEVVNGGPAFKSGLKKGDKFYSINKKGDVNNLNRLYSHLSGLKVNEEIEVKFIRDGKVMSTTITLGSKEKVYENTALDGDKKDVVIAEKDENIMMLDERTLEERGKLGVSLFQTDKLEGLLISEIYKESPADIAGLQEEDLIIECNNMKINNREDLGKVLMDKVPGDAINLIVIRDGKQMRFSIKLD